jgi:hypothetical protein
LIDWSHSFGSNDTIVLYVFLKLKRDFDTLFRDTTVNTRQPLTVTGSTRSESVAKASRAPRCGEKLLESPEKPKFICPFWFSRHRCKDMIDGPPRLFFGEARCSVAL